MQRRRRAVWLVPALALGLLGAGCTDRDNDAVPDQAENPVQATGNAAGRADNATENAGDAAERTAENTGDAAGHAAGQAGDAAGQAANSAARATGHAATAVGEITDNAATTGLVKNALIADKSVPAMRINVDTENDVVTLKGDVDTAAQKARAEALARKVNGVKKVVNKLTVKGK